VASFLVVVELFLDFLVFVHFGSVFAADRVQLMAVFEVCLNTIPHSLIEDFTESIF
jgi:hypothetical protein